MKKLITGLCLALGIAGCGAGGGGGDTKDLPTLIFPTHEPIIESVRFFECDTFNQSSNSWCSNRAWVNQDGNYRTEWKVSDSNLDIITLIETMYTDDGFELTYINEAIIELTPMKAEHMKYIEDGVVNIPYGHYVFCYIAVDSGGNESNEVCSNIEVR